MRIYPVVSNAINIELEDGTIFELYEGTKGLDIKVLNGVLVVGALNVASFGFDEVWRGSSIHLTEVNNEPHTN